MPLPAFLKPAPVPSGTAAPAAAAAVPVASGKIDAYVRQQQTQLFWCWAAVSSSVADLYGSKGWSQCDIATAEFASHHWACCGADGSDQDKCDQAWHLDRALERVGHLDRRTHTTTSFADLQAEVNAGRPLCCRIVWADPLAGAHFTAVTEWSVKNGTNYVSLQDPVYGPVSTTYANLCTAYQSPGDEWSDSYFTTAKGSTVYGSSASAPAHARAHT